MHVLHVINGLTTGGAETVLYRLTTYPSKTEHEVICLEGRSWYSGKLEAHGIKVHHLDWNRRGAAGAMIRLHKLIRMSPADVVQAWMYRSNLVAGLSARLAGKPVVWNIRASSLEPLRPASRYIARLCGLLTPWVPRFVINCSAKSRELHARLGYERADGAVISNGYDPAIFRPDDEARGRIRRELGLDADDFAVGTICRWHAQKGLPVLLQALRLLTDRGVPVRLLMAGRDLDPANRELARVIDELGCRGSVQLLGERGDVPDVARALDLHVLASIGAEGFANSVAETMLSGTPNVATDVGDAALIVGETGWLVPPNDAEALARAIEQAHREWHGARPEWERRRSAARERIAGNFSLEQMVAAYEDVWRQVVNNAAGAGSRSAAEVLAGQGAARGETG